MAHYIKCSTRIYQIYMNYVDAKDIHVYSIDEVFIDATEYLKASGLTAHRHHGHSWYRAESLSLQGCHGHLGKAYRAG